jgi:hypothetical protein
LVTFFIEDGSGFYQPYDAKKDYLIRLSAIPDQRTLKSKYELDSETAYYTPYDLDKSVESERLIQLAGEVDKDQIPGLKNACK